MEPTSIIAALSLSLLGNVLQFILNKKSNDIKTLKDRIELIDSVQDKQTKYYEKEMKYQNDKIVGLQKNVDNQADTLKRNGEEIARLQRLIGKLIGNGCHLDDCPNRSPYTVEEINEITKNSKKNGKNANGNKK